MTNELALRIVRHFANHVTQWTLRNSELYPEIGMWRDLMDQLNLPRAGIEQTILAGDGARPFCAIGLLEQVIQESRPTGEFTTEYQNVPPEKLRTDAEIWPSLTREKQHPDRTGRFFH